MIEKTNKKRYEYKPLLHEEKKQTASAVFDLSLLSCYLQEHFTFALANARFTRCVLYLVQKLLG